MLSQEDSFLLVKNYKEAIQLLEKFNADSSSCFVEMHQKLRQILDLGIENVKSGSEKYKRPLCMLTNKGDYINTTISGFASKNSFSLICVIWMMIETRQPYSPTQKYFNNPE